MAIDPGHGGDDAGIQGINRLSEKFLALAIAHELALMKPGNYSLVLTRERDLDPGLEKRAETANHAGADLYISLHTGSGFSQNPGLCRIIYKKGNPYGSENPAGAWVLGQIPHIRESSRLAEHLAKSLMQDGLFKTRTEEVDSIILAPLAMPAVLIELGNLLSPQDALALSEKKTQKKLAQAIHQGISAYIAEKERAVTRQILQGQ